MYSGSATGSRRSPDQSASWIHRLRQNRIGEVRRGTYSGTRDLHQQAARLHGRVELRIRLRNERTDAQAVDTKVLRCAVEDVDARGIAVRRGVEGEDGDELLSGGEVYVTRLVTIQTRRWGERRTWSGEGGQCAEDGDDSQYRLEQSRHRLLTRSRRR